ncbi:MAG: flagellin [Rhodosalinus sp.]
MTIGNALFTELTIRSFRAQRAEISDLQGRIAAGTQDPRASADPLRFVRLSAAQEQQETLGRFADNLTLAGNRLDHADTVLKEVNSITQRLGEIALRAATDSTGDDFRSALVAEVEQLRSALVDMANATDGSGESLFAGMSAEQRPFRENAEGRIIYHGDNAVQSLRYSETRSLETGVSGAEAFTGLTLADGETGSVFDLVDDLAASIGAHRGAVESSFAAEGAMRLDLNAATQPAPWRLTIVGPVGRAEVSAPVAADDPAALVAAINAATGETGVSAAVAPDGAAIDLSAAGGITVSRIVPGGPRTTAPAAEAVALEAGGTPIGPTRELRALRHDKQAQMDAVSTLQNHFDDLRSKVGALGAVAETQGRTVENRQVMIREAVAGLEDLDIAAAITDLRSRLVTLQAAQQSFVKVSGLSLFDFMR